MPRFRAFDFLDEVQRQRQVLLSCYLVAIPFHLETIDQYAHNGSFVSDSFRAPWHCFSDEIHRCSLSEGDFPSESDDENSLFESDVKLSLERYEPEEEVVYIPSSNPSSPAVTSQECLQLKQSYQPLVFDVNGTEDTKNEDLLPVKEGFIKVTSESTGDNLFLETPMPSSSILSDLSTPQIEQLCLHLKKKQVRDPLAESTGKPSCSSVFFRNDCSFTLTSEEQSDRETDDSNFSNISVTDQDFAPLKITDKYLLEVTARDFPQDGCHALEELILKYLQLDMCREENTEFDMEEEVGWLKRCEESEVIRAKCETMFLSKESIRDEDLVTWKFEIPDKFPAAYLQEEPPVMTIGSTPPPPLPSPLNDSTKDNSFGVCWEGTQNIVSQKTVSEILSDLWKDQRYFGAISSLILKEPSITPPRLTAEVEYVDSMQIDLLKDLKAEAEDKDTTSLDSINLVIDYHETGRNLWDKKIEKYLTNQNDTGLIFSGDDDAAVKISWADSDPFLSKLSLNALCDSKVKAEQESDSSQSKIDTKKFQSLSSKIAVMMKTSSAMKKETPSLLVKPNNVENTQSQQSTTGKTAKGDVIHHWDNYQNKVFVKDHSDGMLDAKLEIMAKPSVGVIEKKPEKRKSYFSDPLSDILFLSGVSGYRSKLREDGVKTKVNANCYQKPGVSYDDGKVNLKTSPKSPHKHAATVREDETGKKGLILQDTKSTSGTSQCTVESTELLSSVDKDETQQQKKMKRSKTSIITVKITDEYKSVLDVIEQHGGPFLKQLQIEGVIPLSFSFASLKSDTIRSLVQQEFEEPKDCVKQAAVKKKLQGLTQLYVCLSTSETVLRCNLNTAIAGLNIMIQKYQSVIQGTFDPLHESLVETEKKMENCLRQNPKITELTKQINLWYRKKTMKAGELDLKVLIILKKHYPSLANNIITALNSIMGLRATSLDPSLPASPAAVSEALDSSNCIVVVSSQIDQDFLWAQFSLVVEYEAGDGPSIWQNICTRQNIRHLGLKMEGRQGDEEKTEMIKSETGADSTVSLKLLCSPRITENPELLRLLESKYNITVLERNYTDDVNSVCADITVDVVTGVTMLTPQDVLRIGIEGLTKRVNLFSQQYQKLWVLISGTEEEKRDLQSKTIRRRLCQLCSAIAQYSKREDEFEAKVVYGFNAEETSELIQSICQNAEINISSAWHREDWLHRHCITAYPSKHEVFLTQFPSINSFTAQVLLTAALLAKLLSSSTDELSTLIPWVPSKFLKIFEQYLLRGFDIDGSLAGKNRGTNTILATSQPASQTVSAGDNSLAATHSEQHCGISSSTCSFAKQDEVRKTSNLGPPTTGSSGTGVAMGYERPASLDQGGHVAFNQRSLVLPDNITRNPQFDDKTPYECNNLGLYKRKHHLSPESLRHFRHLETRLVERERKQRGDMSGVSHSKDPLVNIAPPEAGGRTSLRYVDGTRFPALSLQPNFEMAHDPWGKITAEFDCAKMNAPVRDVSISSNQRGQRRQLHREIARIPPVVTSLSKYSKFGENDQYLDSSDMDGRWMRNPTQQSCLFDETGWRKDLHPRHSDSQSTYGAHTSLQAVQVGNTDTAPNKHRRLAYEKVPGSVDGQTKLKFL